MTSSSSPGGDEKEAIRSHPLFPTLQLALEACEEATKGLADPSPADDAIVKVGDFEEMGGTDMGMEIVSAG